MTDPHLWTQREAAAALRVSVSWLRASECPKVRLRSQGMSGRGPVRYDPDAVRAWWRAFSSTKGVAA